MVLNKTLNNLKDGPKEDKVAVASGIAISLVVVLLAAWAIYFFHKIQSGQQSLNLGGAVDQFVPTATKDAQQQLQQQFGSQKQDLQDVRTQSTEGGSGQMQTQPMQTAGDTSGNQFSPTQ